MDKTGDRGREVGIRGINANGKNTIKISKKIYYHNRKREG